jgi:hypothetical protein
MTEELYKGFKIRIVRDDSPADSPRNWDCMTKMFCFHRRYNLGDKHDYSIEQFDDWHRFEAMLKEDFDVAIIQPVWLYDHSGQSIKTCAPPETNPFKGGVSPFNCRFDSGVVGFVFVTKDVVRNEYSCEELTPEIYSKAQKVLEGEVETYNQWMEGDIWGYEIMKVVETKDADGNQYNVEVLKDSCWGFYGESVCLEEARRVVDNYYEDTNIKAKTVKDETAGI